jgi:hypothetical protein
MKERFAAFCLITILTFTPALYAQTTTPVLSQEQQDFVRALCLTAANDPDTPGELLPPGMTAEQFADACVVVAFYIANDSDFKDKYNALTLVVTDNRTRIVALESATPVDVTVLETKVATLENQVAALEAALASVKAALGTS